ncbi:MAG: hypothetical protein J6P64_06170, partial [Bacteroidales bacterium]|nr:hypothetical protein [Bacteroidales bacterium]
LKGLKDNAFRNTVNYVVELFLHPLISLIGTILLFCYTPWKIAVLGSIFLYISYTFFMDSNEFIRIWMSDIRWVFNKKLRKEFDELF